MFFFILFNYTILRDTKDVLMVTAKKSGAEVIPFIKTYVNLPVRYFTLVCASPSFYPLFFCFDLCLTHRRFSSSSFLVTCAFFIPIPSHLSISLPARTPPPPPPFFLDHPTNENELTNNYNTHRRPSDSRPCTASFAIGWNRRTYSTRA